MVTQTLSAYQARDGADRRQTQRSRIPLPGRLATTQTGDPAWQPGSGSSSTYTPFLGTGARRVAGRTTPAGPGHRTRDIKLRTQDYEKRSS